MTEASLEKDPVRAYIQTALWASTDDDGNPLYDQYGYEFFFKKENQLLQMLDEFLDKKSGEGIHLYRTKCKTTSVAV